jgi:hypothetical protein
LHQHIELGTVLVDCSPQQIRLAAQRHEHLVQMTYAARPGPRRFGAPGEFRAEFVAPATDRFVRDHDATLSSTSRKLRLNRKYHRTAQLMTTAGKR